MKIPERSAKSLIPNRRTIHDRPKEADGKRFGDWEMDLVIGAGQKSSVLATAGLAEAKSLLEKLSFD